MVQRYVVYLLFSLGCRSLPAMSRVLIGSARQVQNQLYAASGNAEKLHKALAYSVEQQIHQWYAAINFLKDGKKEAAIKSLEESENALQNLMRLLDPKMIVQGKKLNSFACEFETGVLYLQNRLKGYLHILKTEPSASVEELLQGLEYFNAWRRSFFAGFMQWDSRLMDAAQQLYKIEGTIDAIAMSASHEKSFIRKWFDTLLVKRIDLVLDASQRRLLEESFELLKKEFKAIPFLENEKDEKRFLKNNIRLFDIEKGSAADLRLSHFKNKLEEAKNVVTQLNRRNLTKSHAAFDGKEREILQRLANLPKMSIFFEKKSILTSLQQQGADAVVHLAQGTLLVSDEVHKKFQKLESLFSALARAVGKDGSFEKHIDAGIEYAQKLSNEKAIIQALAQQVHDYNIEQLIGLTDLAHKIADLVQDIAKSDTAWSSFLQKLNPSLHEFLRSCEKEDVVKTLRAADEIARAFHMKQPISKIALISARHGATISLTLEGFKLCMKQLAPYFKSYSDQFQTYADSMIIFNAGVQSKGQEILLENLIAQDLAYALQILAETNNRVDTYQKVLELEPLGVAAIVPDISIEAFYATEGKLQSELLEIIYQLEQPSVSPRERDTLLVRKEQINQERYAGSQKLKAILESIHHKRIEKYEPFCHKSDVFDCYKNLALLKHDQRMIEEYKKIVTMQLNKADTELHQIWGNFEWNVTNLAVYTWKYIAYIYYWVKKRTINKRIEMLVYQKKAWESAESWNKHQQEKLLRKMPQKDICIAYLKALHPTLFSVL